MPYAWASPVKWPASPARAALRWSASSSSSLREVASFGYAPSASALGNSTTRRRSPTPRLWAPPPCGNGPAATQRCLATEEHRTRSGTACGGEAAEPDLVRRAPPDVDLVPGALGRVIVMPWLRARWIRGGRRILWLRSEGLRSCRRGRRGSRQDRYRAG